jgi:hypothetical protein
MCWVRLGIVLAGAWVVLLFGPAKADAVPTVVYKCTPAPQDCSAWFKSNVSIDWTVAPSDAVVSGCQDKVYSFDTPGTNDSCIADDGTATVSITTKIKLDKTPPVITGGQPSRGADVNGWYNRAVGISFSGSDQTSGIDFCTSTTYGGPDSASASVAGRCYDQAGNQSIPLVYGFKYDQTAPVLTGATPERPPNTTGWFTQPVRFDIQASDATSGIADCPSVIYGGPNSAAASFTGSCRDQAGNAASRIFSLKYDATPPGASAQSPPQKAVRPSKARLLSPRSGALVRPGHPPLLMWTPVRGARYYNLQLWRNGRKILSAWPKQSQLQLKRHWEFGGRKRRLAPGRYRWLVWPGYGPRSRGDYGRRIGPSTFRVGHSRSR